MPWTLGTPRAPRRPYAPCLGPPVCSSFPSIERAGWGLGSRARLHNRGRPLGAGRCAFKAGRRSLVEGRAAPHAPWVLAPVNPHSRSAPLAGAAAPGGHLTVVPRSTPAGRPFSTNQAPNRPLVAHRPLPYHPPAGLRRSTAGIAAGLPLPAPGTTLQSQTSFRGPPCKLVTQIVKPFDCFL
jgi:hypothetical protein